MACTQRVVCAAAVREAAQLDGGAAYAWRAIAAGKGAWWCIGSCQAPWRGGDPCRVEVMRRDLEASTGWTGWDILHGVVTICFLGYRCAYILDFGLNSRGRASRSSARNVGPRIRRRIGCQGEPSAIGGVVSRAVPFVDTHRSRSCSAGREKPLMDCIDSLNIHCILL